jgi:peptidoglycan/xylan/chitin deacetylase (PgdA/CDA1 family)
MSHLVISLDFELFWGVSDTRTVAGYGRNVRGEWDAVPRMLALFRQYGISATWATVGMAMCRNHAQWRDIRPAVMPGYRNGKLSPYSLDALVREQPRLFFARPLVEQILATPLQELATHTYSHFYCNEAGATPEQLTADLACAQSVAAELGVRYRSVVFPRNQIVDSYLSVLPRAGISVYRGNRDHWLYRDGDAVTGGLAGRAVRFADGCLPLSGNGSGHAAHSGELVNVPASFFLYPWTDRQGALAPMRLLRLKQGMTDAARTGRICHIWWHPHNFGAEVEKNLSVLESLLRHYQMLADRHGMQSRCMADFAESANRGVAGRLDAAAGAEAGRSPAGELQ